MPRRSRGTIGRVRAAPGALPTAGRSADGTEGRADGIPGKGKGLTPIPSRALAMRDPLPMAAPSAALVRVYVIDT